MTALQKVASHWTRTTQQDRSRKALQSILEATELLMANRSFSELSVAEIARAAGVSIGCIYARVSDKQALLGAIFERDASELRALFDELASPEKWEGVPLVEILQRAFPFIVAKYRARQGLIRAFMEHAGTDARFREAWTESGAHSVDRILRLVMSRLVEVDHPDPERGVRMGLEMVFATLVHRIQMREIDRPDMDELTEELIRMMQLYMGIHNSQGEHA